MTRSNLTRWIEPPRVYLLMLVAGAALLLLCRR